MSCIFTHNPVSIIITKTWDVNFCLHFHRHFEFVLVTDGQLFMEVSQKEYAINRGDAIWIGSYIPHSFRTPEHSSCYIMEFLPDILPLFSEWVRNQNCESPHLRLRTSEFEYLTNRLSLEELGPRLSDGSRKIIQPFDEFKRLYLEILCCEFIKNCVWYKRDRRSGDSILAVLEYMEENYASPISLESAAEFVGIRRETLARKFRQTTGGTFLEYLQSLRVYHACAELKDGSSTADTAYATGFGSIISFNRAFRKITGFTPSEYKKRG